MPLLLPSERIGSVLSGRYELREILGEGGMGVVHAATNTFTHREVGIKLTRTIAAIPTGSCRVASGSP